jgi:hypothetical protein
MSRLIMKREYAQFFFKTICILKSYSIERVPHSRKVMLKTMTLLPYGSVWNIFNISLLPIKMSCFRIRHAYRIQNIK